MKRTRIDKPGGASQPQTMVMIMSGERDEVIFHKIVTIALLLVTFLIGCDGAEKPGSGLVIRETGYLECDLRPDLCTDGQIACTDVDGEVNCVDPPSDCDEPTCACLADVVCDDTAECSITDAADTLICTSGSDTWDACDGKACGDDCT